MDFAKCARKGIRIYAHVPSDGSGRPAIKSSGREIDQMSGLGTFGTETLVPQDAVVPIDKDMPFAQAALNWMWRDDGCRCRLSIPQKSHPAVQSLSSDAAALDSIASRVLPSLAANRLLPLMYWTTNLNSVRSLVPHTLSTPRKWIPVERIKRDYRRTRCSLRF